MGYEFSNDRWIQNKKREIREGKCCVICNIRVVYKCKQCNTIEIVPLAVSDVSTLLLIVADYNVYLQAINGQSRIYNARSASNYSYQQRGQFLDGTYANTLTPTVYCPVNCYRPKYQTAATFTVTKHNATQAQHGSVIINISDH